MIDTEKNEVGPEGEVEVLEGGELAQAELQLVQEAVSFQTLKDQLEESLSARGVEEGELAERVEKALTEKDRMVLKDVQEYLSKRDERGVERGGVDNVASRLTRSLERVQRAVSDLRMIKLSLDAHDEARVRLNLVRDTYNAEGPQDISSEMRKLEKQITALRASQSGIRSLFGRLVGDETQTKIKSLESDLAALAAERYKAIDSRTVSTQDIKDAEEKFLDTRHVAGGIDGIKDARKRAADIEVSIGELKQESSALEDEVKTDGFAALETHFEFYNSRQEFPSEIKRSNREEVVEFLNGMIDVAKARGVLGE